MESAKSPLHGALFWMNSLGAEGLSIGEIMLNHDPAHLSDLLLDSRYAVQAVAFTYPKG